MGKGVRVINEALIREVKRLKYVRRMKDEAIQNDLNISKGTLWRCLKAENGELPTSGERRKPSKKRKKGKLDQKLDDAHKNEIMKEIIDEEAELIKALKLVKAMVGRAVQTSDDTLIIKLIAPYVDIIKTSGQLKKFNLTLVDARSQTLVISDERRREYQKELLEEMLGYLCPACREALEGAYT
jgi:hypothetical protein